MSINSVNPNSPIITDESLIQNTSVQEPSSPFDALFAQLYNSVLDNEDFEDSAAIIVSDEQFVTLMLHESFKELSSKIQQQAQDFAFDQYTKKRISTLFGITYATALRHSNYWHTFKEYPAKLKILSQLANKNYILARIASAEKILVPVKTERSLNDIRGIQKAAFDLQNELSDIKNLLDFLDADENEKIEFLIPYIDKELFPTNTLVEARNFQNNFKTLVSTVQSLKEDLLKANQVLKQVTLFNISLTSERSKKEILKSTISQKSPSLSEGEKIYQCHALVALTECRIALHNLFIQELKAAKTTSSLFKAVSSLYSQKELTPSIKKLTPSITNLLKGNDNAIRIKLGLEFMMDCFESLYKNSSIDIEIITIWLLNKIPSDVQKKVREVPDTNTLQTHFANILKTQSLTFVTLDKCLK